MGSMVRTGPTTQELSAANVATAVGAVGYDASILPRGVALNVRFVLTPAGCSGVNCSVEWLTYSTAGHKVSVDWLLSLSAHLGRAAPRPYAKSPSILKSWKGRWTTANPLGAVANTIATRGAYAQQVSHQRFVLMELLQTGCRLESWTGRH